MAYPALVPNDAPIATTTSPMRNGAKFDSGAMFRRSSNAAMSATRIAVPITWSMNGLAQAPWKYFAGKVAKTANVFSESGRAAMWLT